MQNCRYVEGNYSYILCTTTVTNGSQAKVENQGVK